MADLYLKNPKTGEVEVFDEADAQAAANAGYSQIDEATFRKARAAEATAAGPERAAATGLVTAPEGYDPTQAFAEKVYSGLTFGQGEQINTPEAIARGNRYQEEHPVGALAGEMLGQTPYTLMGGVAGSAARGALGAAGRGVAGRVAGVAADYGVNAVVGGAQMEGEQARLAAEEFSFTDAAVAGVVTEVAGRGAAWAVSKGVGGARNLMARAERNAVTQDAERSLSRGGWVQDYRVAQHAEQYQAELADLTTKDLDSLETSFAEVSRQDRKRSRIERAVIENPAAQHEINVQSVEQLQRLRGALGGELAEAPGGPAKRLAKQLDDRIAALEEAPKGRKLWRILDENRQALQEYRQDLYQAYDTNPGSAWLSREGLGAIDAAEEATRNALLREDAWGEQAARMQREYNVPFHEKWFPARQTVLKDLHFATGKDAQGFTTFRGEPGKMLKLLQADPISPDVRRLREQFAQYLDGAQAIAHAGAQDSPKASRDALEAIRRLRKGLANAESVRGAAARTASRTTAVDVGVGLGAAAVGMAAYGPVGLVAGPAARGFHLAEWLGRAAKHTGLFQGEAASMAALLEKGALAQAAPDEALAGRLADDIFDREVRPGAEPFAKAESLRPGPAGGAIEPQPTRGVGVGLPKAPESSAGIGQPRRAAADRPAGMYAIEPQRPVEVGPAVEATERGTLPDGGESLAPERGTVPDDLADTTPTPERRGPRELPEIPLSSRPTSRPNAGERRRLHVESVMEPGREARAADAARLQALTEGEFAEVVQGLRATGAKDEATGRLLGDLLAEHADDLKTVGLVVAGTGAAAALDQDGPEGALGAGAGVLGAVAAMRRGKRLPGSWFSAAHPATQKALGKLEQLGFETSQPVANMLTKTFGEKMPSEAQLEKMIPLKVLADLGGPAKEQRIVRMGDDVHWYAEGHSTPVEPHDVRLGDGTMDHDPGGYEAPTWKMARTFTKEADGELTVHHDYFYLRDDLQGTGAGAKILKDQFDAYRELGVSRVDVSCDDVGRYFWPSVGFDSADPRVVSGAVREYRKFIEARGLGDATTLAEAKSIKSLPRLANAEFGKDFLLSTRGPWNLHLELKLDEADPRFHLMRHRLGLGEGAALGGLALVGQIEGSSDDPQGGGAAAAAATPLALFGRRAGAFKTLRAKLVSDVAKKLFSPTAGQLVARLGARAVYTRADLAKRQQEFSQWADNPQELVDRVAEGFRDTPPEKQGEVHAGVFRAATFLKERLPSPTRVNAMSMRQIPVSTEQINKFARYEHATMDPRGAWLEAAQTGHLSTELLETTRELYGDLLAEVRVAAYQTVREEGAPVSIQARASYAQLFDGDGSLADPAFGLEVAKMAAYAFEQQTPTKPGGGPVSSGNVSHVAAASAAPAGIGRLG